MANTYTDSSGNVFPLNAYGRPQGYWQGNKFIFPQFGAQRAAAIPAVDPVAPVAQTPTSYRLPSSVRQQQFQDDYAGGSSAQLNQAPEPAASNVSINPMTGTAAGPSHGPIQYSSNMPKLTGGLFGTRRGVPPAVTQNLGYRLGGLLGPAGAVGGSVLAGLGSGRGGRGIAGDVVGTGIGTALFGPLGFLGGIFGGRIGDMKDMENALAFQERGQRGLLDSLGYGIGLGPSSTKQMEDYYGINQPGIDPFGAGAQGGMPSLADEDDIGDIDVGLDAFSDPFGDIASAFGGDDGMGSDSAGDGMGNMGGDQGGWT